MQCNKLASFIRVAAQIGTVPAAHVTLKLVHRRRLTANDVEGYWCCIRGTSLRGSRSPRSKRRRSPGRVALGLESPTFARSKPRRRGGLHSSAPLLLPQTSLERLSRTDTREIGCSSAHKSAAVRLPQIINVWGRAHRPILALVGVDKSLVSEPRNEGRCRKLSLRRQARGAGLAHLMEERRI